jgi:dUTP pyrophosphatase
MKILFKGIKVEDGILGKESTQWTKPSRGSAGAAGWDLYASQDMELKPYVPTLVPTDLEIAVPDGHMILVLPRSGNSLKKQIIVPNSPGLIDEDYRGHLQVILTWIPHPGDSWRYTKQKDGTLLGRWAKYRNGVTTKITKGDRIAQAVLLPYVQQEWLQWAMLPPTTRGVAGFGSTGT